MIGLLSIVVLFHGCILFKIIPYGITWGGRLTTDLEMYVFETLSILINLFLILILLMKGDYLFYKFSDTAIRIILWVFLALFALNTIGNIFAKTNFEKLFSILTLISAVLIWIILKNKKVTQA